MSSGEPIATFTRDGRPAALRSLVLIIFFAPLGYFAGETVASTLGVGVMAGRVVAAVVPTVLVAVLGYRMGGRGTVAFYDDAVELRDRRVRYDDVTVALREDASFGTATFKLVVLGEGNLTLRYLREPDEVGRALARHLPTPADQLAQAPAEQGERAASGTDRMEYRWEFWEYWRADEPLPETAVVDLATLKRVLGVSAVDPARLDRVDMTDANGLSDIEKSDVTSSNSTGAP